MFITRLSDIDLIISEIAYCMLADISVCVPPPESLKRQTAFVLRLFEAVKFVSLCAYVLTVADS